jgi:iron complex transport system ATP-binding protein
LKTSSNILEIKNLSIGYKESGVLAENINLELKKGELIALIGLNGIGKSTLFKTIMKLHPAFEGSVFINGKNIKHLNSRDMAGYCSYVSTDNIRISEMLVRDLVAMGRYPFTGWIGRLSKTDCIIIDKAIHQVGLSKLKHRKLVNLSDGERQRAAIARALAQDTPLIILDEPTAFLDIKNKHEVILLLQELSRKNNKSILFSSHDLGNVIQSSDKLWVMHDKSITEGAPEDLILKGVIESVFSSESLSFNAETCVFLRVLKEQKIIGLSGTGERFLWTKRALERIGLTVQSNVSEIKVILPENDNDRIKLISINEELQFNSIYDLLCQIKRINL